MGILGKDKPTFNIVSDTPPISPRDGQKWTNSSTGKDYTWYEDGTSGQWLNNSERVENIPVQSLGGVVGYDRVDVSSLITCTGDMYGNTNTITDGIEVCSIDYTPKYANSILIIKACVTGSGGTLGSSIISAIFGGTTNLGAEGIGYSGPDSSGVYPYARATLSTSASLQLSSSDLINISLRAGAGAGNFYVNGEYDGNLINSGNYNTYLEVTEININAISQAIPQTGDVLQVVHHQYKPTTHTLVVNENVISKLITPKSNNSTLLMEFGATLWCDSEAEAVYLSIKNNSIDWGVGDIMLFYMTGGTFISSPYGKFAIDNTDLTDKTLEVYVRVVTGSPSIRTNGIANMTITEVQN